MGWYSDKVMSFLLQKGGRASPTFPQSTPESWAAILLSDQGIIEYARAENRMRCQEDRIRKARLLNTIVAYNSSLQAYVNVSMIQFLLTIRWLTLPYVVLNTECVRTNDCIRQSYRENRPLRICSVLTVFSSYCELRRTSQDLKKSKISEYQKSGLTEERAIGGLKPPPTITILWKNLMKVFRCVLCKLR